MVDERATGVILRTHSLTETSLIVQWLTREAGRLATVAKGARRAKSPFRGKLDLFYLAEFSFRRSLRSELHTLREVTLHQTHSPLRMNLTYLQQVAYCTALIEQTTESGTPIPNIFQLCAELLTQIGERPPTALTVLGFEIKLLHELGLAPDLKRSGLSAGSLRLMEAFLQLDWASMFRVKLSESQESELRQFLHGFLIYHLGKIPRGRGEALHLHE